MVLKWEIHQSDYKVCHPGLLGPARSEQGPGTYMSNVVPGEGTATGVWSCKSPCQRTLEAGATNSGGPVSINSQYNGTGAGARVG